MELLTKHLNKDILTELFTKHLVHAWLEGFQSISQAKWHDQKIKVTKVITKGYNLYVILPHSNLVVSRSEIYLGEEFCSMQFIHQLINPGDWSPVLNGLLV